MRASAEGKAVHKLGQSLDTISFNPVLFASICTHDLTVDVNARIWKIFIELIHIYAEKFNSGAVLNDEEYHIAVQAARFRDTLIQFGDL